MFRLRLGIAVSLMLLFAGCIAATPTPGGQGQLEGQVLIGPVCPVMQANTPCPDQPFQAHLIVLDVQGQPALRFQTAADGRFAVSLAAGTYTLRPEPPDGLARAPEQVVTVTAGQTTRVTVTYDSGLR